MAETDLPEDVIVNILCWLPVKSLIRFTSVSKRWLFIILSDPQFATSQLKAARQRKTQGPRLIISTNAGQHESLDLDDIASFGHPSSVRRLSFPFGLSGRLLGSCNGLVFLSYSDFYFYIWNPATRFVKKFPEPGFTDELSYHGVGYLSSTDDYIVFAASYGLYETETEEFKMFSSRSHVWKTVPAHAHDHTCSLFYQGTLLNEALHWTSWGEILAFDLAPEEFRIMRLPDFDDEIVVDFKNAGVYEGCLCVCSELIDLSVDFWVMKEYGVHDSWTKLFSLSPDCQSRYLGDFLVRESFTVSVRGAADGYRWSLVKIDGKQKEISTYMLQGSWYNCSLKMILYEESLLRINI